MAYKWVSRHHRELARRMTQTWKTLWGAAAAILTDRV
jgi:hypothetical protein